MILRCLIILSLSIALQMDRAFPQQYFVDETGSRFPEILDVSYDATFGDLNGDGNLDVIVANSSLGVTNLSYLILNNGTGEFFEDELDFFDYDITETSPFGVDMGDIERDGDLDIILANLDDHNSSIHRLFVNDGSANFSDRSDLQLPIHNSYNIHSALTAESLQHFTSRITSMISDSYATS